MHAKLKFLVIVLFINASCQSKAQELTRAQALEDIQTLKSNFERYHAGLYRYTSKDSMDLVFDQVRDRVKDGSVLDFYTEVTWLLNKVKCGHTRSSMPQHVNSAFRQSQLFLPLSVRYLGDRLYVNAVFANEGRLRKGEEILSINGNSIADITRKIFSHHSSDGVVNTSKYRQTESFFTFYYQLYVDRGAEIYRIKVRGLDDAVRDVSITGENWAQLQSMQTNRGSGPNLSLEFKSDHALMQIRTFGSGSINGGGQNYYDFLEESFDDLKSKGTKNLILDLRGNGGGDDNYGATLVSYFAKESFGYFDRIEVTDAYSGYGSVTQIGGRNLMTSHRGLGTWQPKNNRFEGNVYVLIDGWSFSTCADVATVLHHHQWATFIGEETGGGYDGNTSGNSRGLNLSNSGIRVNLPMWMYTTANLGHGFRARGVTPDYPVYQTPQELIDNEDVVMKKALSLIQKK